MKFFLVLAYLVASAVGQRPSFAGSSAIGLHPRFKPNASDATNAPDLGSRLGEADATTAKLPVDAHGDANLVNRLNDWPKENRPFWLTNSEIIEQHRGGPGAANNQGGTTQITNVQSVASNVSTQSPVQNVNGDIPVVNRFGENSQPAINNNNSFSILMNGQFRTYSYDSVSDSWVRKG